MQRPISNSQDTFIHLFAGGVAGTAGAIFTCPLEVVKTRLQSSTNRLLIENVCLPKIASTSGDDGRVTCKTIRHDQRRHISTLNPRNSTHLLTFSQCRSPPFRSRNSIGLLRALNCRCVEKLRRGWLKRAGPCDLVSCDHRRKGPPFCQDYQIN